MRGRAIAYLRKALGVVAGAGFSLLAYIWLTVPDVRPLKTTNPSTTAFMELRAEEARESAERLRARIEDLYQTHRISETAYKQGQAEYQHALAKYEDQIAKLRDTTTATGATND